MTPHHVTAVLLAFLCPEVGIMRRDEHFVQVERPLALPQPLAIAPGSVAKTCANHAGRGTYNHRQPQSQESCRLPPERTGVRVRLA